MRRGVRQANKGGRPIFFDLYIKQPSPSTLNLTMLMKLVNISDVRPLVQFADWLTQQRQQPRGTSKPMYMSVNTQTSEVAKRGRLIGKQTRSAYCQRKAWVKGAITDRHAALMRDDGAGRRARARHARGFGARGSSWPPGRGWCKRTGRRGQMGDLTRAARVQDIQGPNFS